MARDQDILDKLLAWCNEQVDQMSVTFSIRGEDSERQLNLSNSNAANLLEWLGYPTLAEDLYGSIPARELRTRCEKALLRPLDGPVAQEKSIGAGGAVFIRCERWPGYLHERTDDLLKLARAAGDLGYITFA